MKFRFGLGCRISTPWTHETLIYRRYALSQAGRRAGTRLLGSADPAFSTDVDRSPSHHQTPRKSASAKPLFLAVELPRQVNCLLPAPRALSRCRRFLVGRNSGDMAVECHRPVDPGCLVPDGQAARILAGARHAVILPDVFRLDRKSTRLNSS